MVHQCQVTLNSNDNLSGVANTFYKLDGGAAQRLHHRFQFRATEHTRLVSGVSTLPAILKQLTLQF
jgi:hypothetical protein